MTKHLLALHFREATSHHTDQIMDMEVKGFAPGNREQKEVYEQRIETFPQGSLMAYAGSDCVGCIFSEIWHFKPIPTAEDFALGHDIRYRHDPINGTELYVTSMTVAPPFRGCGLGEQLFSGGVSHVARRYPQIATALLLVNETWHYARKIYAAAGFKEITTLKHFFSPGEGVHENGIAMRRAVVRISGSPEEH